ncbi:MAG TPA: methionine--tRNA ligase, partial [Thermoplasmatales archaeon]|nr:methionine--tRNA ligase [Thermoplasmatales archaeon]
GSVHDAKWEDALKPLNVGYSIEKPVPLFQKLLLEEVVGEMDPFSMVDLRVAKIISVENHPNADRLYVMDIDVGALGKRRIVAGIKQYYTIDELRDKNIVIVSNLKPAKIRGVESNGMLLAAEDKDGRVVLLTPGDVKPGTPVTVEGIPAQPVKTLEFSEFQKISMIVDEDQKITYQGKPLVTPVGPVTTDKPVSKGAEVH